MLHYYRSISSPVHSWVTPHREAPERIAPSLVYRRAESKSCPTSDMLRTISKVRHGTIVLTSPYQRTPAPSLPEWRFRLKGPQRRRPSKMCGYPETSMGTSKKTLRSEHRCSPRNESANYFIKPLIHCSQQILQHSVQLAVKQ